MEKNITSDQIEALKIITSLFKVERYIYISITVVFAIIFIISLILALINNRFGSAEISSVFGSGGAVTVMTGRIIHMWNRAVSLIENNKNG